MFYIEQEKNKEENGLIVKRNFLVYVLSFLLVLQSLLFQTSYKTVAAANSSYQLGTVIESWTRSVAPGVEETTMTLATERGRQEVFIMGVNQGNPDVHIEVGLPNGKDFGLQTVRKQAEAVSQPGHVVVGGVNADFFNTSNGVPIGSVIREGKILQGINTETFGIKENGQGIIGYPEPSYSIVAENIEMEIHRVNGIRGDNQLVLYTSDQESTNTNQYGTEIILSDVTGDIREVGEVTATVETILVDQGNTPIPEGKLVLSGHGAHADFLQTLKEGQAIELRTMVAPGWEDVKEALGGRITLVKNGEKTEIEESSFTTTLAPRTAVGIKADGSIFFLVIDGRQPGYSEGVTIFELQNLMYDLGAVEALNLDGGGSSTFLTRANGESGLHLMNSPSDGIERSVANSFLVVSTAEEGELGQLAVQPDHMLMLSGSTYDFTAKGMDMAFNPVKMNEKPSWSLDDVTLGTIDSSGKFTAGQEAKTGLLRATLNGAEGTSEITVVNELTDLQFGQDTITVKRGEEMMIDVRAFSNGRMVHANPANFEWEVTGDVGMINEAGTFKATNKTASGTITASFGNQSATMNIQVGKLPVVLETFENGIEDWTWSGARYQSVSIRQTTYPEPARFGDHALELKYDFTGTTGTSGAYAHTKDPIILEDYPEAIGLWVYGDGKGHWLRSQLRDGDNNAFPIDFDNNINWTGWRYLEAPVPAGKSTPLKLDLAVRLMETSDDKKNAGAIYVDNIRAVYGETDDDLINPTISGEYPAANEVIVTNELKIGAFAEDNEGGTGINPSRMWMYIDGIEVEPEYTEETGEISFTPDGPLLDGYHQVKIVVQDHFGNETERIWQFEIDSGSPGVKPLFEQEAFIGNPFDITLQTSQLNEMESLKLQFSFSPDKLDVVKRQLILDEKISKQHIVRNEITENGQIYLELKDLDQIADGDKIRKLAKLPLLMKKDSAETVQVKFEGGSTVIKGKSISIFIPNMDIAAKAHYEIALDRASVGFDSKISVTDERGKPAKGVDIHVVSPDNQLAVIKAKEAVVYKEPKSNSEKIMKLKKHEPTILVEKQAGWLKVRHGEQEGWIKASDASISPWTLGTTDNQGKIKTDRLSIIPGELIIQAQNNKRYSFQTKIDVLKHLGSQAPERTNLTFNGKNKSLNITWTTSPLITNSVVQIVPTSEYEKHGFTKKSVKEVKGTSTYHAFEAGEVQVHTARLNGLKDGEAYTYRVGDGTKTGWSEVGSFTTEKKKDNDFNFILMGDTQSLPNQTENGFGVFTELFTKAKQENEDAAFIVHVGDMVDDGNLYSHWDAFFESMKDSKLAPSTPFVPVVGNHENIGNGVETFKRLFSMPDNGPANFKGTVYSFDYGNAHFAVLNTETTKEGLLEQAEWLKKDMAKSKKKWKIVIYHRSPYNSNPAAGSETVKEVWPPVFDEIGIDLAISGHDHSYVRTIPLKNGELNKEGTTYIIAGSTGQKYYATTPQPYMDVYFDEKTQVYTNVSVTDKGINILVKTRDGRVVDEHVLKK